MPLSGPAWVARFPTSVNVNDLAPAFRGNATRFLAALRQAGANVEINATLRPPQRAYLMHYSWRIAREQLDPAAVPAMAGVDIQWLHRTAQNQPNLAASRQAAQQMVQGYELVVRPALQSRHTQGLAIDMNVVWQGALVIRNASGQEVTIDTTPHSGGNAQLQAVGATYGVIKLATDPPHWSSDGH